METIIETLKLFNLKVERLQRSGFNKRFEEEVPNVMAKFESPIKFQSLDNGHFFIEGKINSWVPDYNEDEIDAVVLTYRLLTQQNDRLSLINLSNIYNAEWFPQESKDAFNDAKLKLNDCLDSASFIQLPDNSYFSKRQIMDVIIYGGLAHSNVNKQHIFNNWMASGMSGFFQIEFITTLKSMFFYFDYFKELNETTIKILEANV